MTGVVSTIFGSIMMRLALIYGALAIMTGTAISVAWLVFQSIAANTQVLSDDRLPDLRSSASIVEAADQIKAVLSDALIAGSSADLERLGTETSVLLEDIRQRTSALPKGKSAEIVPMIDRAGTALATLKAARKDLFEGDAEVARTVRKAITAASEATALLTRQTNGAYFNLVLGGDETVASVEQTLTRLIDEDFALYQAALSAQSEINLLSGLALSASQTHDRALLPILEDLGSSSVERLENLMGTLSAAPATMTLADVMADATQTFTDGLTNRSLRSFSNDILAARQSVDTALSTALDDIYFDLIIKSDDAKTANEQSIRGLMDDQVGQIRAKASLESATKGYIAHIMQTALSRDAAELALQAEALMASAITLREAMTGASEEVVAAIDPMLAIADPELGIAMIRQNAFEAGPEASRATQEATSAVSDIASALAAFSATAQSNIAETAATLANKVENAGQRMIEIGAASLLLTALAP